MTYIVLYLKRYLIVKQGNLSPSRRHRRGTDRRRLLHSVTARGAVANVPPPLRHVEGHRRFCAGEGEARAIVAAASAQDARWVALRPRFDPRLAGDVTSISTASTARGDLVSAYPLLLHFLLLLVLPSQFVAASAPAAAAVGGTPVVEDLCCCSSCFYHSFAAACHLCCCISCCHGPCCCSAGCCDLRDFFYPCCSL